MLFLHELKGLGIKGVGSRVRYGLQYGLGYGRLGWCHLDYRSVRRREYFPDDERTAETGHEGNKQKSPLHDGQAVWPTCNLCIIHVIC